MTEKQLSLKGLEKTVRELAAEHDDVADLLADAIIESMRELRSVAGRQAADRLEAEYAKIQEARP